MLLSQACKDRLWDEARAYNERNSVTTFKVPTPSFLPFFFKRIVKSFFVIKIKETPARISDCRRPHSSEWRKGVAG
jgi:hypothetical protein